MTLKPCPFCGGEAKSELKFGLCYVTRCAECGASTRASKTVEDCEDLWNKRAEAAAEGEEADQFAAFKYEIIAELVKKPEVLAQAKAFASCVIECLADLLQDDADDEEDKL